MSLLKCPDCDNDVSSTAENCPNCGFTMRQHPALQEERQRAQQKRDMKFQAEDRVRNMWRGWFALCLVLSIVNALVYFPNFYFAEEVERGFGRTFLEIAGLLLIVGLAYTGNKMASSKQDYTTQDSSHSA